MESNLSIIIQALTKPSYNRNQKEIREIVRLIKSIKFFQNIANDMPEIVYRECSLHLNYLKVPKDNFIWKYGDRASNFYVLLQGKASILAPVKSVTQKNWEIVNTLQSGSSFGQIDPKDHSPLIASVKSDQECQLAVLDKINYSKILSNVLKHKQKATAKIIKRHSLFSSLSNNFIQKLVCLFTEQSYIKNQIVFKQGQSNQWLYLVKEGQFKLFTQIEINNQNPVFFNFQLRIPRKPLKKQLQIAIGTPGLLLGEDDINNSTYSYSVACFSQQGSLLAIKKTDLLPKLMRIDHLGFSAHIQERNSLRRQQIRRSSEMRKSLQIYSPQSKTIDLTTKGQNRSPVKPRPKSTLRKVSKPRAKPRVATPGQSKHSDLLLQYYKANSGSRSVRMSQGSFRVPSPFKPFKRDFSLVL